MRSSIGARLAASVLAPMVAIAVSIAPVAAQQVPHMPDPVAVTVSELKVTLSAGSAVSGVRCTGGSAPSRASSSSCLR